MRDWGVKAATAARPCQVANCRSLLACGTAWTSRVEELSLAPPARGDKGRSLSLGQTIHALLPSTRLDLAGIFFDV